MEDSIGAWYCCQSAGTCPCLTSFTQEKFGEEKIKFESIKPMKSLDYSITFEDEYTEDMFKQEVCSGFSL